MSGSGSDSWSSTTARSDSRTSGSRGPIINDHSASATAGAPVSPIPLAADADVASSLPALIKRASTGTTESMAHSSDTHTEDASTQAGEGLEGDRPVVRGVLSSKCQEKIFQATPLPAAAPDASGFVDKVKRKRRGLFRKRAKDEPCPIKNTFARVFHHNTRPKVECFVPPPAVETPKGRLLPLSKPNARLLSRMVLVNEHVLLEPTRPLPDLPSDQEPFDVTTLWVEHSAHPLFDTATTSPASTAPSFTPPQRDTPPAQRLDKNATPTRQNTGPFVASRDFHIAAAAVSAASAAAAPPKRAPATSSTPRRAGGGGSGSSSSYSYSSGSSSSSSSSATNEAEFETALSDVFAVTRPNKATPARRTLAAKAMTTAAAAASASKPPMKRSISSEEAVLDKAVSKETELNKRYSGPPALGHSMSLPSQPIGRASNDATTATAARHSRRSGSPAVRVRPSAATSSFSSSISNLTSSTDASAHHEPLSRQPSLMGSVMAAGRTGPAHKATVRLTPSTDMRPAPSANTEFNARDASNGTPQPTPAKHARAAEASTSHEARRHHDDEDHLQLPTPHAALEPTPRRDHVPPLMQARGHEHLELPIGASASEHVPRKDHAPPGMMSASSTPTPIAAAPASEDGEEDNNNNNNKRRSYGGESLDGTDLSLSTADLTLTESDNKESLTTDEASDTMEQPDALMELLAMESIVAQLETARVLMPCAKKLSEEQIAGMSELGLRLDNSQPPLTARQRMYTTVCCLARYMRAREWIVDKAEQAIRDTLAWRAKYGTDTLTADDALDMDTKGVLYISQGKDKEGRAVIVMRVAENASNYHDKPTRQYTLTQAQRQTRLLVYTMEQAFELMKAPPETTAATVPGRLGSAALDPSAVNTMPKEIVNWIIDFKGFSQVEGMKTMGTAQETMDIVQSHYPERLARVFVVNQPWYFSMFWKMIKPLVHANTLAKVRMGKSGSDYSHLREFIDEDAIETAYGGKLEYNHTPEAYRTHMVETDSRRLQRVAAADEHGAQLERLMESSKAAAAAANAHQGHVGRAEVA